MLRLFHAVPINRRALAALFLLVTLSAFSVVLGSRAQAEEPEAEAPPDHAGSLLSITDWGPKISADMDDPQPAPEETAPQPEPYDYGMAAPESEAVDGSYFQTAAFLGDSRTEGFLINTGLLGRIDGFFHTGLNVKSARDKAVIETGDGMLTAVEAISQGEYDSIYIMLGVNELGWGAGEFSEYYGLLIDALREAQPEARIYLQSILPVGHDPVVSGSEINNDNVRLFNEKILALALEKEVYYLDIYSAVVTEDGYLPEAAAPDGVHLGKEYCGIWYDYLKTHTVEA